MDDLRAIADDLRVARERFLASVEGLRPELHRYCTRMTGSAMDGEDVVQEALAQAYYNLSLMRQDVPVRPWLFKITHNKCIDFLRRRRPAHVPLDERPQLPAGSATLAPAIAPATRPDDGIETQQRVSEALAALVTRLPAKERASVVLKDVLDYSLDEAADILDSSVGAVKAALHRGRSKLRALHADDRTAGPPGSLDRSDRPETPSSDLQDLLARYVDVFNRRDWDAVKQLMADEVQCDVVGVFAGLGRETVGSVYVGRYASRPDPWRLALAEVDGSLAVVRLESDDAEDGRWRCAAVIRVDGEHGAVRHIRDYSHVSYLLDAAEIVLLDGGDG